MVNWDAAVVVASSHLMLPAVFCRLQQRGLLDCLPVDLIDYLKELTELNRNRNRTLLEEAQSISKLFTENEITFVFLKGIAIMAGNYYKDHGERMIGDIDILVAPEHLNKAFELLSTEGYTHTLEFNYDVKNYRHRPRQISEKHLGAIELHGQLLKHGYNHLLDTHAILIHKEIINELPIPKSEHLIAHAIYSQQINDKGYYYNVLNLKCVYDVLVLNLNQEMNFIQKLSQEKYSLQFLKISSIFFPEISPSIEKLNLRLTNFLFVLTLKHPKIGLLLYKVRQNYSNVVERIQLVLFNKSYRKHLLKNKIFKRKM